MILNMGGISEGVFAFFIVFCTLVGMITGAYLTDKDRLIMYARHTFLTVRKGCLRYAKIMMEKGTW